MSVKPKADDETPITVSVSKYFVQAPPDLLTQHNVFAATGIKSRPFLELLREPGAPPVSALGKTRAVDRVAFIAFIKSRGIAPEEPADVDSGDGVAKLAAELGFKLKPAVKCRARAQKDS